MRSCIEREYSDPDNAGMVYETREGGYQGVTHDTYDLISDEIGLDLPSDDGTLFTAIVGLLGDQLWCDAELYALSPAEEFAYSWDHFCDLIKHKRRYFFGAETVREDSELIHPNELLPLILSYAESYGLLRAFPAGQRYYRIRLQEAGKRYTSPSELGPPPVVASIKTNRMSPPGVVMTYAAEDISTAIAETFDKPGIYATAVFRTTREIRLLDLVDLPDVPGFFAADVDSSPPNERYVLQF